MLLPAIKESAQNNLSKLKLISRLLGLSKQQFEL